MRWIQQHRKSAAVGVVLAMVAALASTASAGGATSSSAAAAAATAPTAGAASAEQVTLITGDRVRLTERHGRYQVEPQPAWGRTVGFVNYFDGDHVYVIPTDAAPLVESGVLDRRLFDVAELVRQGYHKQASLPLIVQIRPGVKTAALTGAKPTATFRRTGLTALSASKPRLGTFWNEVKDTREVSRIWLDATVRPALDQSVPQVRAPQAWQAGYTGDGVKVAVLDTGYDAAHPDLQGNVAASKNFTSEPDTGDLVGHGTHVASTLAGSGAASNGKYKGVAPDVDLLIGKVLGVEGGTESTVLAGMEWAAVQGARVVNLSLGAWDTPQQDPVEQAVDRLSADGGPLFVVAAGNDGPGMTGSPGSAEAALTVGSVSKSDVMSEFSGGGPTLGTHLVKPELVAPGESIVAARARGTLPDEAVDEHHARLDGTSMATPHVAGGAAILAQQHPGWNGQQLKAALTASAGPIDGAGVYQQGAGRLDVARAVRQPVTTTTAAVNFGNVRWPHDEDMGTKTIAYQNVSDAPVTLNLTLASLPDGAFSLEDERITVPANGSATATLRYDLRDAPIGVFGGWISATSAGDGENTVVLRTPIGGQVEFEHYDVDVRVLDRAGQTAGSNGTTYLFTGDGELEVVRGNATVRLPAGKVHVLGYVSTPRPGKYEPSITVLTRPALDVRADTALTLDARTAPRSRVRVERPDARHATLVFNASFAGSDGNRYEGFFAIPETTDEFYAGGYESTEGSFLLRERLVATDARLDVREPEAFSIPMWWVPGSPRSDLDADLELVDAGAGTPAELAAIDVRGKAVLVTPMTDADVGLIGQAVLDAGGKAVVVRLRTTVYSPEVPAALPMMYTTRIEADRLAELAGTGTEPVTISLLGKQNSPYLYDLVLPLTKRLPPVVHVRDRELAAVTKRFSSALHMNSGGQHPDAFLDGEYANAGWCCEPVKLPLQRTEYFSPAPVEWTFGYSSGNYPGDGVHHLGGDESVRFRAGERRHEQWGAPVFGPSFTGRPGPWDWGDVDHPHWVYRQEGKVQVMVPLLSDGDGHPNWSFNQSPDLDATGVTRLYRDGTLVGSNEHAGLGSFEVPDGPATLTIATEFRRDQPWWPLSTRVNASWTVQSSGDGVLPLMAVRFRPEVGLSGQAPGGRTYRLPVSVQRETGAPASKVQKLTIQVSYDDGTTWKPVKVTAAGSGWLAELKHPKSGHVSLRAQAKDAAGNTVDQTIIRAYQLT